MSFTPTILLAVLTLVAGLPQMGIGKFPATPAREPAKPATEQAKPAREPAKAAPVEVPMEMLAGRPLIRVTINGQGPFPLLVGPDVQKTLIDRKLVELLKITPLKTPNGGSEHEVELGFGTAKGIKVPVDVTDTARFVPELGSMTGPRGVVSLSIWKDHLVTIDYVKWRVKVEPGALPEPNGQDVFGLDPASRELRLELLIKEKEDSLWCRVDPLFPRGLLLPASYVKLLPLVGDVLDAGSVSTREKSIAVREARLATSVTLGAFEFDRPIVLFGDDGEVATVGSQWLNGFSITYDLTNARARLLRRRAR